MSSTPRFEVKAGQKVSFNGSQYVETAELPPAFTDWASAFELLYEDEIETGGFVGRGAKKKPKTVKVHCVEGYEHAVWEICPTNGNIDSVRGDRPEGVPMKMSPAKRKALARKKLREAEEAAGE